MIKGRQSRTKNGVTGNYTAPVGWGVQGLFCSWPWRFQPCAVARLSFCPVTRGCQRVERRCCMHRSEMHRASVPVCERRRRSLASLVRPARQSQLSHTHAQKPWKGEHLIIFGRASTAELDCGRSDKLCLQGSRPRWLERLVPAGQDHRLRKTRNHDLQLQSGSCRP